MLSAKLLVLMITEPTTVRFPVVVIPGAVRLKVLPPVEVPRLTLVTDLPVSVTNTLPEV